MIETKRLIVRPLITDNDHQVAQVLADPELLHAAHISFTSLPASSFEIKMFLQAVQVFGIYQKAEPTKLLGLITADQTNPALATNECEVGYLEKRTAWGQGIMTEALRGFLAGTPLAIVATTDEDNVRSQHVLRNSGFRLTGREGKRLIWRRPACTRD
jgi:RimJ/RimL family protein N-acetyltransferase